MSLKICRCCAGKMTVSSPRNPNICLSCEQLLDDDGARLETLLASVPEPDPPELPANQLHEAPLHPERHEPVSFSI